MKTEPVTQAQVDALIRAIGPVAAMISSLDQVDLVRGRGILQGNDRCLWTKDGRRIIISLGGGGVCVSCSKTVDNEEVQNG